MANIKLDIPLSEESVRSLKLGDAVFLTGRIYTARDAAHKYLAGKPDMGRLPDFRNGAIYHCGPVIVKENGDWRVTAAGPTTSSREEPYEAFVIEKYGIRAIIGKGGMGKATLEACRRFGCVYLHAIGGAAQVLANAVQQVSAVHFLEEFGAPEAIWQFEAKDFPAVVTMDAAGHSLHAQVLEHSLAQFEKLK
ncbi:MAG: fumarate hydratase C-terminal domain-containing protein [Victivallales bacterium]|nr:fumarate hydratase C-terminal domain-containing protein [Victivallales bacterium]